MASKEDALRILKAKLMRKFGAEVRDEVINEIFDAGAWYGAEFITDELEKRVAERKGVVPDRAKLS